MKDTFSQKRAVALSYDQQKSNAPKIVATGRGHLAEKILEQAARTGVLVHHDPDLVKLLSQLPSGEEIPVELYQAVAELLAFIYQANEQYQKQ